MRLVSAIRLLAASVALVAVAVSLCFGTMPTPPFPGSLTPVAPPKPGGPVELRLEIRATRTCEAVTFSVDSVWSLEYQGEMTWVIGVEKGSTYSRTLHAVISPNDTSMIRITIKGCRDWGSAELYFVPAGDTAKWFQGHPKDYLEWPDWDTMPRMVLGGQSDSFPVVYERDSTADGQVLVDSSGVYSTGGPRTMEELQELEKTPLTARKVEGYEVDGKFWTRRLGEYKFRRQELLTEAQVRVLDEGRWERTKHEKLSLSIDLRKPEDYEFVKQLVDSLAPMERPGFYHAVVTRELSARIQARHIPTERYPGYPGEAESPLRRLARERNKPGSTSDSAKEKPKVGLSPSAETIERFHEGFEDGWPGFWMVGDANSASGYDYWGQSDQAPYTVCGGFYNVWCNEVGGESWYYDDNMFAYMIYTDPISIVGLSNVTLNYCVSYATQVGHDFFRVYYSFDEVNYTLAEELDGIGLEEQRSVPINGSGTSIHLKFIFQSDAANETPNDGVYLDEISVTGEGPRPNLTLFQPSGWDAKIVVSPVTGTHTAGVLYAGEKAYVDFAIKNTADGSAGAFGTFLYVDGQFVHEWSHAGMSPGQVITITDYQIGPLGQGYHSVGVYVDAYEDIQETNESDNELYVQHEWLVPMITVTGTMKYTDPKIPATFPARRIPVQLWDADVGNGNDSLGSALTGDNGSFVIGPVSNIDAGGTSGQDIYLKVVAKNIACNVALTLGGVPVSVQNWQANDVARGTYSYGTVTLNSDQRGAFYIADVILSGYFEWMSTAPSGAGDPGHLPVVWQEGGGTGYHSSGYLEIDKSVSAPNMTPDTYDGDIILHEYGHHLAYVSDFVDNSPGGNHQWQDVLSPELAGSEAFAHFWSSFTRGSRLIRNTWTNFAQYWEGNLENGQWVLNDVVQGTANDYGEKCEAAVAGMLWDIYDNIHDDQNSDGVGDTLTDGVSHILNTFINKQVSGHKPDNADEFWAGWFTAPSYGHVLAMRDIWNEHGECCFGMRGNADYDLKDKLGVSDVTFLLAYLFESGPPPVCIEEANINGDASETVNVADVTYLLDYMFGIPAGPPPPACP
jgi:hypothetical protein